MSSSIRFSKTCTIRRPTLNGRGQAVVGSGTVVKCALWRQRLHNFVGNVGEVRQYDATLFVPSGTDIELRDQVTQAGVLYVVVSVTPADDDLARLDHIGAQLRLVG